MAYDALTTQVPRAVLIGNGTRGPYTLNDSSGNPIRVRTHSHLVVRRYSSTTDETGTALVLNTDFTASLTDVDAVTITLTSAQAVLASTERLVVTRLQSLADVITLSSGGNFSAEAISAAVSVLVEELQEARRDIDRSIKVDWRETSERAVPIAPSDASKFLIRKTDGSFDQVSGSASIGSLSEISDLGSNWETHLGKPLPWFFAADYGVVADGTTNDAVNFQAAWDACAAAGGGILWIPEGTMKLTTQVTLNGNFVTVRGMGRKCSIISSSYTSGPAIILGNNSTQTVEYAFEDMRFTGTAGQTFFKSRYVRGLYFRRIYEVTDRFLWLGDSAAGTSKPTYVVHLEDISDSSNNVTPTLHHIYAENFAGQYITKNFFAEGQYTAGLDGFYAGDNIQNRIDHFVVMGGYFGRFRDSYSFVDARVVNLHIDPSHESEGALRNSVRLEVTTSTSKTTAQVGWGNVLIAGKFASSGGNALYLKNERASTDSSNINIGPCVFTSEITYTPVVLEAAVGSIVAANISNLTVDFSPVDASQDVVKIVGGSSATTIYGVTISNLAGRANTTALRSVVRVEGVTAKIARPKNLSVFNATVAVSDARLSVLDEHEYIQEPEGRLTLTTATPVLASSVTAATSIYYTPYRGNRVPLLTESLFCERSFSELTLALDNNSGNTGYHQSGKNFDMFVYNDAGTLRLCSGPAWTNDTARATSLTMLRGLLVNSSSITLKYDATSATISAAANSALYVGTFRASADGQTEMSIGAPTAAAGGTANKLYLWNAYNRMPTSATCRDSTDTYTYTTATWQSKNASDSNRISFVFGLAEGAFKAVSTEFSANSSSNVRRNVGIGYDSNTAIAAGSLTGTAEAAASNIAQMGARFERPAALGFHYVQELEYSAATGTTTWYGDAGGATVFQTGMTVELMM